MTLTLERQAFTVEPLSAVLGASIAGLDLREPLSEITKRAVYDAFIRYHVLCFRDQHLDQEQQVAFTEQFGTLERHIASNRGKPTIGHTASLISPPRSFTRPSPAS